jgi:hypothetical protein
MRRGEFQLIGIIVASRRYDEPHLDEVVDSHERDSMDFYDNRYELWQKSPASLRVATPSS